MVRYWITGMEAVQAVQLPDNSIPLIGFKSTFVRVYLKSDSSIDITGYLITDTPEGRSRHFFPIFSTADKFITVTPDGSHRERMNDSLIFQLDYDVTAPGRRDISAWIYPSLEDPPPTPPLLPTERFVTMRVEFTRRIDLHIYGVVWAVTNNDDHFGPPEPPIGPAAPWSDFEDHRRFVENLFPLSSFTIDPIPGIGAKAPDPQPFGNLTDSRTWAKEKVKKLPPNSIINMLDNWSSPNGLFGNSEDHYCEEENARDQNRVGVVMAQEVSHTLGLYAHTFDPGSTYPRPDGTVGSNEVGIDITGPQPRLVVGSYPLYDIMSYHAGPPPKSEQWVSSFTYLELLNAITGRGPFESLGDKCQDNISVVTSDPCR